MKSTIDNRLLADLYEATVNMEQSLREELQLKFHLRLNPTVKQSLITEYMKE